MAMSETASLSETSQPPPVRPTGSLRGRRVIRVLTPYLFLAVPLALLITFTYVPVVNMFNWSFTNWDGLSKVKRYVGFDNYEQIFTRPDLFIVFRTSLYYIGASFVQIGVALYFATILSFPGRLKNLFKGILFFPYLINGAAIALIFLYFFQPGGTLDATLRAIGLGNISELWLGDRGNINYSLAGTSVWRYMGLNFVLFLGAIQSIPNQLYEAAEIDGASRWQQFRHIVLPGIRPVVGISFILAISGSLSVFEIPFIMTGGANGSETFVIKTVDMAFHFHKFGLANAMAVTLLLIVLIVTWIQRRMIPDDIGKKEPR